MADLKAVDALELVRSGRLADVMSGLETLASLKSSRVTADVVAATLEFGERHVAQYAGFALAECDREGAAGAVTAAYEAALEGRDRSHLLPLLHEMAAEVPGKEMDELLARSTSLRSKNPLVRGTAIEALGWRRSPLVVDSAIDALGAKDEDLRNVACVALGRVGDSRAVVPLLSKLDDTDGGTAGFAAIAIGRIEDDRVFKNVSARLGKGNVSDKAKALVAAAREQHTDELVAMLRGGSKDRRIAAASALGKLGSKEESVQTALLNVMLGDSDRWVRGAAFSALGSCADEKLAPHLDKRMGQKDPHKRMFVYELAGDVRAKGGLAHIVKAAWGEKRHVLRRVAQHAFWRIADPEAITAVEADIRAAKGKKANRAAEFLGMRRNRNGFDLAVELVGEKKEGSREELAFEYALEMQTGHFFGADPSVWKEWIEKNDKFFEKEQAAIEREKWREDFLKENKGPSVTPRTERTVQNALDYLARHQRLGGAFDQQTFLERCDERHGKTCPISAGARVQMDPVGVSSLCTLAFFGAGCTPVRGRYRSVVARAVEYTLSRQLPVGDYASNDLIGGYNRPLALQTLSEAAIATKDETFVPFVQRGVDFLASIQAEKAGWRYRVVDNANDTSVVSWVLFGAKSAEKAGARVRRSIYEGCDIVLRGYQQFPKDQREDFIRDIDPHYDFDVGYGKSYQAETGYQDPKSAADQATTPLGLMSRILLGFRRSHPFCIGSANKMVADYLPTAVEGDSWQKTSLKQEYPIYFFYYGTLSMHQMGGRYFRVWNSRVREILPHLQETEGCSRGAIVPWSQDGFFSQLYTTAMAALTLETYYRYAPILQD